MHARRQSARANNGLQVAPVPNALGTLLPSSWLAALAARREGLGLTALLSDHVLDRPADPHGFDPVLARRVFFLLSQTVLRYFRVRTIGAEHIPAGRALLVGCHSGVFAWDATCLVVAIYQATGRFSRNVGDHFFGTLGSMGDFLRRTGVVIGRRDAVEGLLAEDELVLLFPGGADDMLRPVWRRYRLTGNRGSSPDTAGTSRRRCAPEARLSPSPVSAPRIST